MAAPSCRRCSRFWAEGDALVVTRLDRLGRSIRDLANIAHEIEQAGAHLKVLEQSVDTSSAAGRAFFGMLATFAAFETDVRRERQLEGIAMAKRQGVYKGGKARLDRERVKELSGQWPGARGHCPRAGNGPQLGLPASRRAGNSSREHAATRPGSMAACRSSPHMARAAPDEERGREPLSGLVERVTFHSAETGFCVLRVKVRGHRDLVTVLGSAAEVHAGESIQASGQWQQHREHGLQFRAAFLQVVPPSSIEGIERYLAPA